MPSRTLIAADQAMLSPSARSIATRSLRLMQPDSSQISETGLVRSFGPRTAVLVASLRSHPSQSVRHHRCVDKISVGLSRCYLSGAKVGTTVCTLVSARTHPSRCWRSPSTMMTVMVELCSQDCVQIESFTSNSSLPVFSPSSMSTRPISGPRR